MVRNASRTLKIGVHLPFDPNFDVGIGTFYPKKFGRLTVQNQTVFAMDKNAGFFLKCDIRKPPSAQDLITIFVKWKKT